MDPWILLYDLGWDMLHLDEVADLLLHEEYFCDVALPRIPDRYQLEQAKLLPKRLSPLEADLMSEDEEILASSSSSSSPSSSSVAAEDGDADDDI
jgi:pre-mRNA-splicing factor 38A